MAAGHGTWCGVASGLGPEAKGVVMPPCPLQVKGQGSGMGVGEPPEQASSPSVCSPWSTRGHFPYRFAVPTRLRELSVLHPVGRHDHSRQTTSSTLPTRWIRRRRPRVGSRTPMPRRHVFSPARGMEEARVGPRLGHKRRDTQDQVPCPAAIGHIVSPYWKYAACSEKARVGPGREEPLLHPWSSFGDETPTRSRETLYEPIV